MSIDLTLDRIRALAAYLPPYTRPTCHVAGTNGKGSVACLLSSILYASEPSLSVGRFNSPHLVSICDCITINNVPVTIDVYSAARRDVEDVDKLHSIGASSFELLTLTALLIFERTEPKLDIVVLEVGMGGRLDATNAIQDDCILVSALTSVDLDHQNFLGNTVADIAREKAGIARPGKPFVIVKQKHPDVIEVVQEVVTRVGGSLVLAEAATSGGSLDSPETPFSFLPSHLHKHLCQRVRMLLPCFSDSISAMLPLYGQHQLDNLGLALAMISTLLIHPSCIKILPFDIHTRITPVTVARGIELAKWPGRLSFHTISLPLAPSSEPALDQPSRSFTVLADGAHNPASAETLGGFIQSLLSLSATRSNTRPMSISLTYILALSHSPSKSPLQTLLPLFSTRMFSNLPNLRLIVNAALVRFTSPEGMPWVKSVAPSELQHAVAELAPGVGTWVPDDTDPSEGQLSRALTWAATIGHEKNIEGSNERLLVVAGSLYLVADLYRFMDYQQKTTQPVVIE